MVLDPVTVHEEAQPPPENNLGKTALPPQEEPGTAADVTSKTSETVPPQESTPPPNQLDQSQVQDGGNDLEMDVDQPQSQCISSDNVGSSLIADAVSPIAKDPPPLTGNEFFVIDSKSFHFKCYYLMTDISLASTTPTAEEAIPKQPPTVHQDSGLGGIDSVHLLVPVPSTINFDSSILREC